MQEIRLPELGENIAGAQVVKVLVHPGERVEKEQPLLEVESEKASMEIPSPVSGTVREVLVSEGQELSVHDLIVRVDTADDGDVRKVPEAPFPQPLTSASSYEPAVVRPEIPAAVPEAGAADVPAGPQVRRLARELGVDLHSVKPTGPSGRISEAEVKAFAKQIIQVSHAVPFDLHGPGDALPDFTQWGECDRMPMSQLRKTASRRLSHSWRTVPQVTHFDEADITELENFLRQHATAGGKPTLTSFIVKATAHALHAFPGLNLSMDTERNEIIRKKYYHVGIAVDTERGLLVPVIRDVDRKNLKHLAEEIAVTAERARSRKLSAEDMQGGCITVTNLGGIGGTGFTPLVNWPEVAIVGVARSRWQPVYRDGAFVPRRIVPLCISYDHRVVDGAEAARFLRWLAQALAEPFLLEWEG